MGFKFATLMAATILAAFSDLAVARDMPTDLPPPISPPPKGTTTAEETKADTTKPPKIVKIDQYTRHMAFGKDNTFRVVQLSDLWIDGDSQHFIDTADFIDKLLKKEKPNLIVISGDTVDPALDKVYQGKWESIMEKIIAAKIPYVATGGSLLG